MNECKILNFNSPWFTGMLLKVPNFSMRSLLGIKLLVMPMVFYSGKISHGANFRAFRDHVDFAKTRTAKF